MTLLIHSIDIEYLLYAKRCATTGNKTIYGNGIITFKFYVTHIFRVNLQKNF